ncbi:MAG: hypothetical protein KDG89_03355 [Geminicoccaceae bacterium]|nr:hypothetical protein [Geminicoccaceae bacterium]
MRLDRDSGAIGGEVLKGAFAGRALDGLAEGELMRLLAEVAREDGQGRDLLEAYLDRRLPDWRRRAHQAGGGGGGSEGGSAPAGGRLDRATALSILGLGEGATPDEVRAAHRRLMANLHPDHGGSDYLASQINQARDILLHGG